MTIVLCGGGSGGHITPLLAVARELRSTGSHKLVYLGEKRGKFSHIAVESGLFDECRYISAGKLRRYHNEPILRRITDIKTIFLNIRDIFRLIAGTIQSLVLFRKLRPDSVLLKGGYVCVPASIGAKMVGSFIVTHDSDALPGLSNRLAARYASVHATAMPEKYYRYPKSTLRQVGLPIDPRYRSYSKAEIRFLKEKYGIPEKSRVILVTGGSLGARRLNEWALTSLGELLGRYEDIYAVILTGRGNMPQVSSYSSHEAINKRLIAMEFTDELFHLAAFSDVIITRAGATTITEFAASSKACILIPNPDLTGGHQMKNAMVYAEQDSAIVILESDLKKSTAPLTVAVETLFQDSEKRRNLGEKLKSSLPEVPAAKTLAEILVSRRIV